MDQTRDDTAEDSAARHDFGLTDYRPLPGVPDELAGADGSFSALWQPLLTHLEGLGSEDLARAMDRADQYLRDSGVIYRQYGTGSSVERPWPLSHVPVLIGEDDWNRLSQALVQRADLLEALMADLYGPNRLVAEGHLPAGLIAANPEWLRPMVGVAPRSGHYLHFVAFEIGRGPDGQWWVLADRTQAPSGAGYALENRVATARAFASLYPGLNIHRLSGFFRDFRDSLLAMRGDSESRVAILTPGPWNETYYEQAWLARYMGISLVQGEDLTVEKGRVMIRTVSGLWPLDVLWRRLDGSFADPLELDSASRLGTAGMVSALRQGGLTMVNSLGSGVLETRALMAFLPKLAPILTGRSLDLPNIATWWCGTEAERAAVCANPARMILSPALATGLPFDRQDDPLPAATLAPGDLARRLAEEGEGLVAQEMVTLSTTPALVEGRLSPRPMSLRVYLARGPEGWRVMPGGFARIGASPDPTALAMQRGGRAADIWIMARDKPAPAPMVTPQAGPHQRSEPGALPSRAADNLFWLGRYVERTEGIVRLLRARHSRLAESGSGDLPLNGAIDAVLSVYGINPAEPIPQGLLDTLALAVGSAAQVRDRLSPDGWSALSDLDKSAHRMTTTAAHGDDAAMALSALLRKIAGFSGLVHENMYRFLGWRFLSLGRLVERAYGVSGLLARLADPEAAPGALELCVELGDSVLSHRRRFIMDARRETVIDLLALDPMNPRSLRHQTDAMMDQIRTLPGASQNGQLSELGRAMLRVQTLVATETPETLTTEVLLDLRGRIGGLSDLLTEAYFR